jgi:signal transduction histidine kinase
MSAIRESRFLLASRAIGGIVFAVACAVLVGWQLDIAVLKSVAPQFVTMKANTAVCFALSGAILFIDERRVGIEAARNARLSARVLTIPLLAIAAATLLEYVFATDIRIDQFLFHDVRTPLTPNPGRMSPATAISFLLIGAAFWLLPPPKPRRYHAWQWSAVIVFIVGYIGVIGYVYNEQALYHTVMYTSVAVHTSVLFVLLGIGLLMRRPALGFMRLVVGDGASGVLLRRLLPVAILLPPLVDWLQVHSTEADTGGYDIVAAAMLNVVFLFLFVWWTAKSVRAAENARRTAEASARTGEERLHIALQAAVGGAWDWDLKTDVAWWSPEMYSLWNVSQGTQMERDNSLALVDPKDRDTVGKAVDASIAAKIPYHCEFRLVSPAQTEERWMASRGNVVFDDTGNPARLVGITIDITMQKRTESDLREVNEALTRSNAELRHFAHVASHDLQTPMRSVASFAELLRTNYAAALDARGNDWLKRIEQSIQQLQTLVRDLLHYASLDSQAKSFAPVDMGNTAARAVALLDSAIRESNAQVTCGELPTLFGDATLLQELLQNLIANALKYRGQDAPRVNISADRIGDAWQFAISDNGIGIEPRFHERIFETFERLHTQQQIPGTGIGLAICRRVVNLHGGKLWVESELGRGSKFCFTLPTRSK